MQMAVAPRTLEGWYCLHDLRSLDWAHWRSLSDSERQAIAEEAAAFMARCARAEDTGEGASPSAAVPGHKGDMLFLHMRPGLQQLTRLEHQFNQLALADFTERTYSFVSVTKLSQYVAGAKATATPAEESTPEQEAFIQRRLKPELP